MMGLYKRIFVSSAWFFSLKIAPLKASFVNVHECFVALLLRVKNLSVGNSSWKHSAAICR